MSGSKGRHFEGDRSQNKENRSDALEQKAERMERSEAISELDKGALNDQQRQRLIQQKQEREQPLSEQIRKNGVAHLGVITKNFGESVAITHTDPKTGKVNELVRGRSKEEVAEALRQMQEASDKDLPMGDGGKFVERARPTIEQEMHRLRDEAIKAGAPETLFAVGEKRSEYKVKLAPSDPSAVVRAQSLDQQSLPSAQALDAFGAASVAPADSVAPSYHKDGAKYLEGKAVHNEYVEETQRSFSEAISSMSEHIGSAITQGGFEVSKALESLKDAVGLNLSEQPQKPVHAPTGDGSTLPKGVQNAGDVAQLGVGSASGYVQAINEIMPALTPQGLTNIAQSLGDAIAEKSHPRTPEEITDYVRGNLDPIYVIQRDGHKVAEALVEWANNRSSQSFSERGREAGELAPILEGGAGFFKSGRAAKSNEIAKDLSSTVKNVERMTAEEIAEHAADLGIDLQKIEKVQGRMPLNWDYAGRNFTFEPTSKFAQKEPELAAELAKKYPDGVHFSEAGFAEFDPYAQADVLIKMTGKRSKDFRAADRLAGISEEFRYANLLVWHHHHEVTTVNGEKYCRAQLLPRDLHKAVRHTGGCSVSGLDYKD